MSVKKVIRESQLSRAAQLPAPTPGGITAHLPLELMPEWLSLHGIEVLDVSMAMGGPLIVKGKRSKGVDDVEK